MPVEISNLPQLPVNHVDLYVYAYTDALAGASTLGLALTETELLELASDAVVDGRRLPDWLRRAHVAGYVSDQLVKADALVKEAGGDIVAQRREALTEMTEMATLTMVYEGQTIYWIPQETETDGPTGDPREDADPEG